MIVIHITSPGSKQGKTTTAERIIRKLTESGAKVCAIKHTHHSLDIEDKDTDRLHKAGSYVTVGLAEHEVLIKSSEINRIANKLWNVISEECGYIVIEGLKNTIPVYIAEKALVIIEIVVSGNKVKKVEVSKQANSSVMKVVQELLSYIREGGEDLGEET